MVREVLTRWYDIIHKHTKPSVEARGGNTSRSIVFHVWRTNGVLTILFQYYFRPKLYDNRVESRYIIDIVAPRWYTVSRYIVLYPRNMFLFCFDTPPSVPRRVQISSSFNDMVLISYMSTQREVFEGQTMARRAKGGGLWKGGPGVLPRKFSKTCIANGAIWVIPELYVSIQLAYIVMQFA